MSVDLSQRAPAKGGNRMDQGQESRFTRAVWATRLARTKPAWFIFALIVLGASVTLLVPTQSRAAADSPAPATMTAGGKLFVKHCAACHQVSGKGIPGAFPPLAGNANLKDTKLVVGTIHDGKTGPITINGKKFNSTMPPIGAGFTPGQTAAVATFVRNSWGNSFGAVSVSEAQTLLQGMQSTAAKAAPKAQAAPAPSATAALPMQYSPPDTELLPPSLKGVARGGRLYRLYCAGCHRVTAVGSALPYAGINAPSLQKIPMSVVPIFIRQGPGPMPAFPKEVLSNRDVTAITKYIHFLQHKPSPGGWAIGFIGPFSEGFVAIAIGLLAIVLCAVWIEKGERG